jgi:hypothetical protein
MWVDQLLMASPTDNQHRALPAVGYGRVVQGIVAIGSVAAQAIPMEALSLKIRQRFRYFCVKGKPAK